MLSIPRKQEGYGMKFRGIRLFALLLVTAAVLSGLPLAAEEPPSVAV